MPILVSDIDITDDELQELSELVRMFLRDYADNNIALMDVQFTDTEIKRAVVLATSEFNSVPVRTTFDWRLVPEHLLFIGCARWLMQSESFLQLRNQMSIPSDGIGVIGLDDKWAQYTQAMQDLRADFQQQARAIKDEINLSNAYGSFSSGYVHVSRFHHS